MPRDVLTYGATGAFQGKLVIFWQHKSWIVTVHLLFCNRTPRRSKVLDGHSLPNNILFCKSKNTKKTKEEEEEKEETYRF